ncbi:hypothetical protein C882_3237 [Caenispirillum salinarum AK4]|uniref:Uncharacterized protein n=1 Tax=Caenispirillum salinarum AK4 TaxID=1238182 RepID=K9HPJ5_9PROT|nr:hypothetical protein C882_3237 [Caenispirillum salinarum AK4]
MRLMHRYVAAAGLLLAAAMPVAAQEPAVGDPDPRAQALVEDLRRAVLQAERSGAATAAFIEELRALIARYDAPYAQLVVRDTFQDGAYRSDPRWVVVSGQWQAVAGSVVSPPTGPALAPPDRPPDDAERLQEQLGAVTRLVERLRGRATSADGEKDAPPPTIPAPVPQAGAESAPSAMLALPVHVPPVFRLTARVTLEDDPERHDAGLSVRDGEGETGYRVRLGSFASRSRVELERLTDRGPRTLGSEVLDDSLAGGPVHSIALERDQDGRLTVRVNDVAVVSVEERQESARLEHVMLERMAGRLIVSQVEVWTAVR